MPDTDLILTLAGTFRNFRAGRITIPLLADPQPERRDFEGNPFWTFGTSNVYLNAGGEVETKMLVYFRDKWEGQTAELRTAPIDHRTVHARVVIDKVERVEREAIQKIRDGRRRSGQDYERYSVPTGRFVVHVTVKEADDE